MFSIGQLAAASGEPVKTLRYWTDRGLLACERGENRYRLYDEESLERIATIRRSQRLGLTLQEIADIIELQSSGVKPCRHVEEKLLGHLESVRRRLRELQALETQLLGRIDWVKAHPEPNCDSGLCVYLEPDRGRNLESPKGKMS